MDDLILEIVEGPDAGRHVALDGPVEIGRATEADLDLNDRQASHRHARIQPADRGAVVEDLGSTNGTFVNDDEIHSPTTISPGDHVLIGLTVLELRTAADVDRQASAVRSAPPTLARPGGRPDYLPAELQATAKATAHELDPLLDAKVKRKANTAPLAILLIAVFVVLIYLATTRG